MIGVLPYDLSRLTRWSVPLTWVIIAINGWYFVVSFHEIALGISAVNGNFDATVLLAQEVPGPFELAITVVALCFSVVVTVLHAMWIYRAAWNSSVIRPLPGRISPGWAVGWYFIPVANLWMPFFAMQQAWNASLPPSAPRALLAGWWAFWVLSNFAMYGIVALAFLSEVTPGTAVTGFLALLDVLGVPISVLSSILFLQIVRKITAAQSNHSPAAVFA